MTEESSSSSSTTCDCLTCPQNIRILLYESENVTDFLLPNESNLADFLDYHASNYMIQNPHINISIEPVTNSFSFLDESDWQGSIFPSRIIGSLVDKEKLWDLTRFISRSSTLDWTEILPFFRNSHAVYSSTPRVIPLDGDLLSMFYRKDLFDKYNMTIPRTWDEYSDAAAFFHNLPEGPGGTPLAGSCISRVENCGNAYWTNLILASMTQALGTSTGFFLDPTSLDPLFGLAMEETLRITREQLEYGHSSELTGVCHESNDAFNAGSCALTYNWGKQIIIESPYDIGVAPTPGSPLVMDRETGKIVKCTTALCPFGDYYDDIGIVNRVPYAGIGGWSAGVSAYPEGSTDAQRYAVADFFAYVSNSRQSIGDILPNDRSDFAQPYRYTHTESSQWIEAGYEPGLATSYTEAIRQINSENSALELRTSSEAEFSRIIDEEVFEYLLTVNGELLERDDDLDLRRAVTARMEEQVASLIEREDRPSVGVRISDSYRESLGFANGSEDLFNYINEDFRDAAWGLSGLMCVTAFSTMIWILRLRSNRVMKAFQPFLLIQSALGLLLLSSSIIPLGFDDSSYTVETLNVTCMLAPWLYIIGYTIFFSSVYSKIRECIKIYQEPHKHDVLLVQPRSSVRLTCRLLIVNGTIMGLWQGLDPLRWERREVTGGIVLVDGTVETYGACDAGNTALGLAIALYGINMLMTLIATLQAFKCRFLVLEFNEMQWIPMSLFPFLEVWAVGCPVIALITEEPTITFAVIVSMIFTCTVVGGLAVFAPKDWYIRKYYNSPSPEQNKNFSERTSSAGVRVLKHPTVENRKQTQELSLKLEQVQGWNTELEIEIRVMKEKFKEMTMTTADKYQVRESLIRNTDSSDFRSEESRGNEEYDNHVLSRSNDEELEEVRKFEQVWQMQDDDEEEEDERDGVQVVLQSSESLHSAGSSRKLSSSFRGDMECAPEYPGREDKQDSQSRDPLSRVMMGVDSHSGPKDPLAMDDISDSGDEIVPRDSQDPLARVMAGGDGFGPKDPLALVCMSDNDEEDDIVRDPEDPLSRVMLDKDNDSSPRNQLSVNGNPNKKNISSQITPKKEKEKSESEDINGDAARDIIARIIALKMALANDDDNKDCMNPNPEDPLERLRRMEEEEGSVLPLLYQYKPEEDDEDDKDVIIRKKDFHELSSMIQVDDLEELEKLAALLAESVKTKLTDSNLADLTTETDTSVDTDSAVGYLALAKGGHKDVSIHSDSAPESLARKNSRMSQGSNQQRNSLSSSSSPAIYEPAGESSTDAKQDDPTVLGTMGGIYNQEGNLTQNAGEPSQGDTERRPAGTPPKQVPNGDTSQNDRPPKKPSPVGLQKLPSSEQGQGADKSYQISDWVAVGGVAGVLAEWSDSQSTSSLGSSVPDSTTSIEATTKTSALDLPIANELDRLVIKKDWDGVNLAVQKYESDFSSKTKGASSTNTSVKSPNSKLEDSRKKKRELEAWRASLTKSFNQDA